MTKLLVDSTSATSLLALGERTAPAARHLAEPPWALASRLLRLALPATLLMVFSGLSLLVDTYFVTGLGSAAVAGVSLVFPVYLFLIMAFGGGIGVGLSVVLSLRLGRGDIVAARRATGSAFALALGFAAALMVVLLLGGHHLFAGIAGTAPVLDAAMDFAHPIFLGIPIIAVSLTLSNILRSDKRMREAAILFLVNSIVNAALNPILIYGYLGLPAMGVAGAGYATVAGFLVSAVLGGLCLRGERRHECALGLHGMRIDRRDALEIAQIALPTLGTYVATSSVLMALSAVWAQFGPDALASYGLATRLEYLIAIVVYGIGSAILTLGGEAWGGGKPRELARICWTAAGCVAVVMVALAVLLALAPRAWFELLGAPPVVVDSGARYLRIVALSYPFYAVALTLNYGYQTLARAHLPLVWSLGRGFLVAVPLAAALAGSGASISVAAVPVAVSLVVLGLVTAGWLPRTLARAAARFAQPTRPEPAASPSPSGPTWESLPMLPRQVLDQPRGPDPTLPRLTSLKASALRISPYPLSYSLLWPWYFRRPSTKNHTRMPRAPRRFEREGVAGQRTVRVCAIGDIMVMQRDRVPELAPELVSLFRSADVIVGTCEAAIGRPDCDPAAAHHFLFNMPAAYLRGIIERTGTPPERWYLSAANNHSGDNGSDSLSSTIRYLRSLGVQPLGARIEGQPPFLLVERAGLRIGITAWTHWLNLPEPRAWRSPELLSVPWHDLRTAHQLDCLIGSGHWEFEWQHFPRAETRALAGRFGAAGFDLLIGSHPHVLQPIEHIGDMLCAYSLGNFCSGLGPSFSARMCNVLTIELGTEGPLRGKAIAYQLHLFVQLDDGERVSLVPLDTVPEPLRTRITQRAAAAFLP